MDVNINRAIPMKRGGSTYVNRLLVAFVLVAAVVALLETAPTAGDFSWSDAPRHALNGAFVKDFVQAWPFHHPVEWATNYYLKYPSLSILFYPPLFYVFEASVYSITGVSHFAAQATVALFTLLLAVASYLFARLVLPQWSALGVALLTIGAPEVAYWGRQVMLDIPAYGVLLLATYLFARYLLAGRPRDMYFATIAAVATVYIKLNMAYIIPVFAIVLFIARGREILRDRHVLLAAGIGAIGLIPAALLTLFFGRINIQSLSGRESDLARTSVDAWIYYAKLVPSDLSYPVAALAVLGFVLLLLRQTAVRGPLMWLLVCWFGIGYLFFSAISVREPRHGLTILFPLTLCAVLALHRFLPKRIVQPAAFALGLGTLGYSLLFYTPTTVTGYQEVVDFVEQHAPKNAVVVFSGIRDGNFVFDLRTRKRSDITTVRATKLLLGVAVERERGVTQADYDEKQIASMLRKLGADLVVYEPGFWSDLREMSRFAGVIHTRDFARVARFQIRGDVASETERHIEIYKPTYEVVKGPSQVDYDMPIIGKRFKGSINSK